MTAGSTNGMPNIIDHECLRLVRCPCAPRESADSGTRCVNVHEEVHTPNRDVYEILSVRTGFHDSR
jgi:hypothetical protein